jgi:hypothetical protein
VREKLRRGLGLRPRVLFTLFVTGAMAYWVVEAIDFPSEDRFLPWLAGFFTLGLALTQLGLEVRRGLRRLARPEDPPEVEGQVLDIALEEDQPPRIVAVRSATYLAWLLGLFSGIWLLGFSTALTLFLFFGLKVQGRSSWPVALGIPLVFLLLMFFIFDLYAGVLWPRSVIESGTGFSLDLVPRFRDWRY